MDGRLYDWSPAVTATPAQAKAVADAYVAQSKGATAASPAPVESLVRVEDVQLKHPFGLPATRPAAGSKEAADFYLPFIRLGIDPVKTHLGDPLPMDLQVKVKQEMDRIEATGNAADSAGGAHLDHLYRGHDGWIYAKNSETQEDPAVQEMRGKHAQERMRQSRDPSLPAANDNDAGLEGDILRFYAERDQATDATGRHAALARIEQRADKLSPTVTEKGQVPEGGWPRQGTGSKPSEPTEAELNASAADKLKTAATQIPAVIAVVEKLQQGQALTPEEIHLRDKIAGRLKKAGIEFDHEMADVDQLKKVAANIASIEATQGRAVDPELPDAVALLNLQAAQALAGGNLDTIRISQGNLLGALGGAMKTLTSPLGKLLPKSTMTTLNIEQAQNGPVEIPDIFGAESSDVSDISEQRSNASEKTLEYSLQQTASPAELALEPMDIKTFKAKLPTFDEVTIHIGDAVLVQHPHTTATDQILIETILDVASSRGCDPEPDATSPRKDGKSVYGGTEGSQSRITDIEQPGHKGSAQPDATMNLAGHGNKGALYVNSVSTAADLITPTARELMSAQQILRNAEKQIAADPRALKELLRSINRPGHVWLYGKKWGWKLERIRRHVRRKVEELFDKLYQDCLPIGEPDIFQLDDPNDPEFRE